MKCLFRTNKYAVAFVFLAVLFFQLPVNTLLARECPDLPPALENKITEQYPYYIIADYRSLRNEDKRDLDREVIHGCFHMIRLSSTAFAVLLLSKNKDQIKLIVAESLLYDNIAGWAIIDLGYFSDEIPMLEPAKGGMYLDIEKNNNFVITRNCLAFNVKLLRSGQEYVYELLGQGDVKRFRVK